MHNKNVKPVCKVCNPRVQLPEVTLNKDSREYNLSIVLLEVDFSDSGKYTCAVKNPKEKGAEHNATISLAVVVTREYGRRVGGRAGGPGASGGVQPREAAEGEALPSPGWPGPKPLGIQPSWGAWLTIPVPRPVEKEDKTVTKIIAAVVGGVIGLLVLILVVKKLILFILKKRKEKK